MRDIPEPPLAPSDPELEEIIADLIYRKKRAEAGSAELRLIMRELEGLPIMEDFGLFMNHRPVDPRTEPGQILPLSCPRRRTSGSPS